MSSNSSINCVRFMRYVFFLYKFDFVRMNELALCQLGNSRWGIIFRYICPFYIMQTLHVRLLLLLLPFVRCFFFSSSFSSLSIFASTTNPIQCVSPQTISFNLITLQKFWIINMKKYMYIWLMNITVCGFLFSFFSETKYFLALFVPVNWVYLFQLHVVHLLTLEFDEMPNFRAIRMFVFGAASRCIVF